MRKPKVKARTDALRKTEYMLIPRRLENDETLLERSIREALQEADTLYKVCQCPSCAWQFVVIIWDVSELDADVFCPNCHTYTDEFDLKQL